MTAAELRKQAKALERVTMAKNTRDRIGRLRDRAETQLVKAMAAAIEAGVTVQQVADEVGVSRQTVHEWLKR